MDTIKTSQVLKYNLLMLICYDIINFCVLICVGPGFELSALRTWGKRVDHDSNITIYLSHPLSVSEIHTKQI